MKEVYPSRLRAVLPLLVRASSLHVGAAAAAASLRTDLVKSGFVSEQDFNRGFAVARLTPGTNLLALYASLGYMLASWRGAMTSLAVGAIVPALISVTAATAYIRFSGHPLVDRFMDGAQAGAFAVLLWAAVRLVRPVLAEHPTLGAVLGVSVLVVAATGYLSSFVVLLLAGAVGAATLRKAR
jgi:chromate transporter